MAKLQPMSPVLVDELSSLFDIPRSWRLEHAQFACNEVRDGTHDTPVYFDDGIPLVTSKNLKSDGIDFSSAKFISPDEHVEISKRSGVQNGDVLYSMIGTVGNVSIVSTTKEFSIKNVGLFRKNEVLLYPKFLFYWLCSPSHKSWVKPLLKGGNQKFASLGLLRETPVPIASLAEQKIIAQKLDTLLAQVESTKARLERTRETLKRFRQSVLAAAVSGKLTEEWRGEHSCDSVPDYRSICIDTRKTLFQKKTVKVASLSEQPDITLPSTWRWQTIDEVCTKITDGTHHSPKSYPESDFMYVTSKNVREGYIDLSNITFVEESVHREIYSRCDVKAGDVLYVKDGANTGLACVNNIEQEVSLLSSVGVMKTCDFVNPRYLQHYLNSPVGRKLMLGLMGGTAIKRLTLTKIAVSPFSVPPIEEQTEIVRRVEQLFAHADTIEKQTEAALARVNNLTQSILAKAFRGELTAQWRAENPELISGENSAEALLKRIQEERAAQQPKKARKTRTQRKVLAGRA